MGRHLHGIGFSRLPGHQRENVIGVNPLLQTRNLINTNTRTAFIHQAKT